MLVRLSGSPTLGEVQLSRRASRRVEQLAKAVERVTFFPCNRFPRGEYGTRVFVEEDQDEGLTFRCESGRRAHRAAFFLLGGALAGIRERDLSLSLHMTNHVGDEIYDLFESSECDFEIKGATEHHIRFYIPEGFADGEVSPDYGSAKGERIVERLKLRVRAESLTDVVALQAYLDDRGIRILLDVRRRAAARAAVVAEIRAYRDRRLIERREIPRLLRLMEEEPDELPANACQHWKLMQRLPIGIQLAQMLRSWAEGGGRGDFEFLRWALERRSQDVLRWIGNRNAGYRCLIESHLRTLVRPLVWKGGATHARCGMPNPKYVEYRKDGGWLADEMRNWRPKLEPLDCTSRGEVRRFVPY